jgi:prepilin-type N-terminal cleavage/methylation domain-containing protein
VHERCAYTLIEILIVVVILGIAGALVIPTFGQTEILRIQAAVRTIVSDINLAQSDALARQQQRALVFDVPANRYVIVEVPGGVIDPNLNRIRSVNLNNAHKFHTTRLETVDFDGQPVLVFDSMGGPVVAPGSNAPGTGGTIVISGSGSIFEIKVEAYTGRVSVRRLQ